MGTGDKVRQSGLFNRDNTKQELCIFPDLDFFQEAQRMNNDSDMMWNALIQKQDKMNLDDQLILRKHSKVIKYKLYKKFQSDKSAGRSSFTANNLLQKQELRQSQKQRQCWSKNIC